MSTLTNTQLEAGLRAVAAVVGPACTYSMNRAFEIVRSEVHTEVHAIDAAKVREVIAELRAYNPKADEYDGKQIHKYWADKLTAALQE
ncbi:hypothetical protein [Dyella terrae]|uniref:hypothetical protein n=1 Tax=Dyella terrae TaxID=522259 RepID=UPI001EFE27F5|nr:hypothetical protein [Dyella terrae]ULU23786.1 hypothetical protein DYST_00684 [Dyella terrae]